MRAAGDNSDIRRSQFQQLLSRYDALHTRFEALLRANRIEIRTKAHGKFLASIEVVRIRESAKDWQTRLEHEYARQLLQVTRNLRASEKDRIAAVSRLELERFAHLRTKEIADLLQQEVKKLKVRLEEIQQCTLTGIIGLQECIPTCSMLEPRDQPEPAKSSRDFGDHQARAGRSRNFEAMHLTHHQEPEVQEKGSGRTKSEAGNEYTSLPAVYEQLQTSVSPGIDHQHPKFADGPLERVIARPRALRELSTLSPEDQAQDKPVQGTLRYCDGQNSEAFLQQLTQYATEVPEIGVNTLETQPPIGQEQWQSSMTHLTRDIEALNFKAQNVQSSSKSPKVVSELKETIVTTTSALQDRLSTCVYPAKSSAYAITNSQLPEPEIIRLEQPTEQDIPSHVRNSTNSDDADDDLVSHMRSDYTQFLSPLTSASSTNDTGTDVSTGLWTRLTNTPTPIRNVSAALITPPLPTNMSWITPYGTHDSIMGSPSKDVDPSTTGSLSRLNERTLHGRIRRTRRLGTLRFPNYDLDTDAID